MFSSPAEIIKNAWIKSGLTQAQFSMENGIKQYNLSKYIHNKAAPPEHFLMRCMHILGMVNDRDVTPEELSELIKRKISRPDQANIRRAVYDLLHNVA
ncbi:helix-turn-helix domain-containing protein [Undibacterium flavidum]|uniref:Helix-turn-helix transcriptional regulator n=1 Tax=Undibacterium flavidum TaxID=2762297 RepID=A0ABR6YA96_9BURK|nr:helix-turn-helix transcriptional regulator [Undibacterium flavidum]MBC3873494.1 helix-turn-helix transcriptional regulator [Undibacterium flavidum]